MWHQLSRSISRQASVDISEVVKQHDFVELVSGPEEVVEAIAEEINMRITDACNFHKIKRLGVKP